MRQPEPSRGTFFDEATRVLILIVAEHSAAFHRYSVRRLIPTRASAPASPQPESRSLRYALNVRYRSAASEGTCSSTLKLRFDRMRMDSMFTGRVSIPVVLVVHWRLPDPVPRTVHPFAASLFTLTGGAVPYVSELEQNRMLSTLAAIALQRRLAPRHYRIAAMVVRTAQRPCDVVRQPG